MSTNAQGDPTKISHSASKSKKNKKKKSKSTVLEISDEKGTINSVQHRETQKESDRDAQGGETKEDDDEEGASISESHTPIIENSIVASDEHTGPQEPNEESQLKLNGSSPPASSMAENNNVESINDAESVVIGQDQLKEEVTQLRISLNELKNQHSEELNSMRSKLEEAQTGKDHADSKYQKLVGQVNSIKARLGERLKADEAELSQAKSQIEDLEDQNKVIKEENQSLAGQVQQLTTEKNKQTKEVEELRGRSTLSQQNWSNERQELVDQESRLREEFEAARQAMQDWEVLAMEERSVREGLGDRVAELEEHLSTQKEAYERIASEAEGQTTTVDGLQRALQDIHEARKQERRELVETSQTQLENLRKQLQEAEEASKAAQSALESTRKDLDRILPFEKEVKEKNLIIGKQRHELVILGENLTKALRFLRKGKPEDNVDRQLVTNHLLHFLALDRSDPKKFQVLQLISALLGWNDDQKESAGLSRPGSSTASNLRIPLSGPFRRVSSSTSLNPLSNSMTSPSVTGSFNDSMMSPAGTSKEGLAELWSDFLAREAEQGEGSKKSSRRPSSASTPTLRNGIVSPSTAESPGPRALRHGKLKDVDEDSASETGNTVSEKSASLAG